MYSTRVFLLPPSARRGDIHRSSCSPFPSSFVGPLLCTRLSPSALGSSCEPADESWPLALELGQKGQPREAWTRQVQVVITVKKELSPGRGAGPTQSWWAREPSKELTLELSRQSSRVGGGPDARARLSVVCCKGRERPPRAHGVTGPAAPRPRRGSQTREGRRPAGSRGSVCFS